MMKYKIYINTNIFSIFESKFYKYKNLLYLKFLYKANLNDRSKVYLVCFNLFLSFLDLYLNNLLNPNLTLIFIKISLYIIK